MIKYINIFNDRVNTQVIFFNIYTDITKDIWGDSTGRYVDEALYTDKHTVIIYFNSTTSCSQTQAHKTKIH